MQKCKMTCENKIFLQNFFPLPPELSKKKTKLHYRPWLCLPALLPPSVRALPLPRFRGCFVLSCGLCLPLRPTLFFLPHPFLAVAFTGRLSLGAVVFLFRQEAFVSGRGRGVVGAGSPVEPRFLLLCVLSLTDLFISPGLSKYLFMSSLPALFSPSAISLFATALSTDHWSVVTDRPLVNGHR